MNDNNEPAVFWREMCADMNRTRAEQLNTLHQCAVRAVLKPETLTMGEIREVAWGYLMAARANRAKLRP